MDIASLPEALPGISVCILSHNYARFLGQAIDSCLAQEPGAYRLEEIVILDDGSTDETLTLCARYGDRVRVIARPHRGFAATLTESIERCRGRWVALLDADDWFAPARLRIAASHLRPGTLLVQHWEHVVDGDGLPLLPGPHPGGNTSTILISREAALKLVPVTNEKFFHVLDDLGRGVRLTDPLTFYRVHGGSMTDRVRPGVHQEYMAGVARDIAIRLTELRTAPPSWASRLGLRRLAWHYRAETRAHEVEAFLQKGQSIRAWRPLLRELGLTLLAGRSYHRRGPSIRSVLTRRPCIRLAPAHQETP